MQRASEFRVQDGVTLRTCSAEDLVVFKALCRQGEGLAGHRRDRAASAFVLRPRQAHADIANPEAPSTFTHRLRERVRHGRSNGLDLTARKLSGQASERIDLDAP